MGNTDVLSKVITEAGYSGPEILASANDSKIKDELRTRTQEAKDVGLCGVPSYRVLRRKVGQGDKEWTLFGDIVWGQDELPVVEDILSGWDGEGLASVGKDGRGDTNSKL